MTLMCDLTLLYMHILSQSLVSAGQNVSKYLHKVATAMAILKMQNKILSKLY